MSTSPYSLDLREKVIKFLKAGNSQRLASKTFSISLTTVNKWNTRLSKEGNFLPRRRLGAKARIVKEEFCKFIIDNPNLTASQIGKHFSISASGARYWLNKLDFTLKKKPLTMWKVIKKGEKNI